MATPTSLVNLVAWAAASSQGGTITLVTHGSSLKNPDGTSGYGGVLDSIVIYNADTVAQRIKVYRVPSSSSVNAQFIIDDITLAASSPPYRLIGPFFSKSADLIQFQTSSSGATSPYVTAQAYYHEMS